MISYISLVVAIVAALFSVFRRQSQFTANIQQQLGARDAQIVQLRKRVLDAEQRERALRAKYDMPTKIIEFAKIAVKHAQQLGGTGQQKLSHAVSAMQRLDADDGIRDFTDAQIRVAIESVIKETT